MPLPGWVALLPSGCGLAVRQISKLAITIEAYHDVVALTGPDVVEPIPIRHGDAWLPAHLTGVPLEVGRYLHLFQPILFAMSSNMTVLSTNSLPVGIPTTQTTWSA